jgi:hypothetical protein
MVATYLRSEIVRHDDMITVICLEWIADQVCVRLEWASGKNPNGSGPAPSSTSFECVPTRFAVRFFRSRETCYMVKASNLLSC